MITEVTGMRLPALFGCRLWRDLRQDCPVSTPLVPQHRTVVMKKMFIKPFVSTWHNSHHNKWQSSLPLYREDTKWHSTKLSWEEPGVRDPRKDNPVACSETSLPGQDFHAKAAEVPSPHGSLLSPAPEEVPELCSTRPKRTGNW